MKSHCGGLTVLTSIRLNVIGAELQMARKEEQTSQERRVENHTDERKERLKKDKGVLKLTKLWDKSEFCESYAV